MSYGTASHAPKAARRPLAHLRRRACRALLPHACTLIIPLTARSRVVWSFPNHAARRLYAGFPWPPIWPSTPSPPTCTPRALVRDGLGRTTKATPSPSFRPVHTSARLRSIAGGDMAPAPYFTRADTGCGSCCRAMRRGATCPPSYSLSRRLWSPALHSMAVLTPPLWVC